MYSKAPAATDWHFELRTVRAKVSFCLPVALLATLLLWETARVALSQTWGYSLDIRQTQKALALDPGNERFHYALGMIQLAGSDQSTRTDAVRQLRTAVELNPRWARAWSGLAKACFATQDSDCQKHAAQMAIRLAPSNPEYAWDAAIYGVLSTNADEATSNLKRYLSMRPERRIDAYRLLLGGFGDPRIAWQKLLDGNENQQAKAEYLGFLAEVGDFNSAASFWAELQQSGAPLAAESARIYLDTLLANGRSATAAEVWGYLLKSDPSLKKGAATDSGNLVYNGSFEHAPLSYGLDWRYQKLPYVNVNFDAAGPDGGHHALELEFTVPENDQYEPFNQLIPVKPSTSYTLSAMVRSEGITSDSGPRLLVTDPACATCLQVSTQGPTGTTPWHATAATFTTGPQTELVRVSIYRPRSRAYPPEISGRMWFDDVSLRASTNPGDATSHP